MQENCLTLKQGKQIITIRLLLTVLNKGNQAVKFGQLIEYNKYFSKIVVVKMKH